MADGEPLSVNLDELLDTEKIRELQEKRIGKSCDYS